MKLKMKYLTLVILNLLFLSAGFICAEKNGDEDNSPLPDSRPADIQFSYSLSGGMMYYSENIFISKDSCYYSINDGGAITRVNFKLSDTELDKLYSIFTDNRFHKIKTYEEMVYDRGGESISLSWGKGRSAHVSNSGITFVKDSWASEWNACSTAMETIAKEKMSQSLKPYEIRLDSSLFGKDCYLQINRDAVIPKSTLMAEHDYDTMIIRQVNLSPGYHYASITIGKSSNTIKINTDSTKALLLTWKNDSLKYEFLK